VQLALRLVDQRLDVQRFRQQAGDAQQARKNASQLC